MILLPMLFLTEVLIGSRWGYANSPPKVWCIGLSTSLTVSWGLKFSLFWFASAFPISSGYSVGSSWELSMLVIDSGLNKILLSLTGVFIVGDNMNDLFVLLYPIFVNKFYLLLVVIGWDSSFKSQILASSLNFALIFNILFRCFLSSAIRNWSCIYLV